MDQYCIGNQPWCMFCKPLQESSSWDWVLVFPQWWAIRWHTFNWHSSLPCSNFPCPCCASWDYLPRNYLILNSWLQACFGGGGVEWIQTKAGGSGKEPSQNSENPLCCAPPPTLPPIQTHMCGRRDVRRRCLASRGSWLPVDPYPWWSCWHSFCDEQVSAAGRRPDWTLAPEVALLCSDTQVLTRESAGKVWCDRTEPCHWV